LLGGEPGLDEEQPAQRLQDGPGLRVHEPHHPGDAVPARAGGQRDQPSHQLPLAQRPRPQRGVGDGHGFAQGEVAAAVEHGAQRRGQAQALALHDLAGREGAPAYVHVLAVRPRAVPPHGDHRPGRVGDHLPAVQEGCGRAARDALQGDDRDPEVLVDGGQAGQRQDVGGEQAELAGQHVPAQLPARDALGRRHPPPHEALALEQLAQNGLHAHDPGRRQAPAGWPATDLWTAEVRALHTTRSTSPLSTAAPSVVAPR